CVSVFQWHARKISSQPEKDTTEGSGILHWWQRRRRHKGPLWPQPILSLFKWHSRKIGSQPETDTFVKWYIMSRVASVADSDGRSLTCGPDFSLVRQANKDNDASLTEIDP
uniref:IRF tryptophan pentad repeat domain-containing protein n=1 Tax=Mesocestoides corti TaxID=53468 RepID=A0A5K3EKX8_MESCO